VRERYLIAALAVTIVLAVAAVGAVALIVSGDDDDGIASPALGRTATARATGTAVVNDPAGNAARQQYQMMSDGQWDRHWELLHPEQRAHVQQALYARCQASRQLDFESIQVVAVRSDPVTVEGAPRDARAVTLRITGNLGAGRREGVTRTIHQVFVEGQWRWVMTEEALAAFKRGDCPVAG
jgi:hypothetical protein